MTAALKCPECGADMALRNSRYGLFYGCTTYPKCKSAHGAHPNGKPLGVPADKETKRARMRAHNSFDRLWKDEGAMMSRAGAYRFLQREMGLTPKQCHIGNMSKQVCDIVCECVERRMQTT